MPSQLTFRYRGGSTRNGDVPKNASIVEFDKTINKIEGSGLWQCSKLRTVEIPSNIEDIGELAFCSCTSLISIKIPSSVISVGRRAFYDCSSISSAILPNTVKCIENDTFASCPLLKYVTAKGVKKIGEKSFAGCKSLSFLNVSASIKDEDIHDRAFLGADTLINNRDYNNEDVKRQIKREIHKMSNGNKWHQICSNLTINAKELNSLFEDTTYEYTPIRGLGALHLLLDNPHAELKVIKSVVTHNPIFVKERDTNETTPLLFFLANLLKKERVISDDEMCTLEALLQEWPDSVEEENESGLTPITHLISKCLHQSSFVDVVSKRYLGALKLLANCLRDTKPLKKLCYINNPMAVRILFAMFERDKDPCSEIVSDIPSKIFEDAHFDDSFDQSPSSTDYDLPSKTSKHYHSKTDEYSHHNIAMFKDDEDACPDTSIDPRPILIDFHHEPIPGFPLFKALSQLDNEHSSTILLQVIENLIPNLSNRNIFKVACIDKNCTSLELSSLHPIQEEMWRDLADRVVLTNDHSRSSDELKKWGEEYGRFLGKFRIAKEDPKHRSATCVVVFASELTEKKGESKKEEKKVALKFFQDKAAFLRELQMRNYMSEKSQDSGKHVIQVQKAYSGVKDTDEACPSEVEFDPNFSIDLQKYHKNVYVNKTKETETNGQLEYLLVMDCGCGLDLEDIISHQDIAGSNLPLALHISISIAERLQFLNEECGIIHGDVKARNFISCGASAKFIAIDLDNSSIIGKDEAGRKITSTGCLPPEQAEVVQYNQFAGDDLDNSEEIQKVEKMVKEKAQLLGSTVDFASACTEFQNALEKLKDLKRKPMSCEPVIASTQYDLWCFGVLMYYLVTGEHLFKLNTREDVTTKELRKIVEWDERAKGDKLELVQKGWPRKLLSRLLNKDPKERPKRWSSVILELNGIKSQSERHLSSATLYIGPNPELMVREELWFPRYIQSNADTLNNIARKNPTATIRMVGVQGDLKFGVRTKLEWTALQEDIQGQVLKKTITKRPEWLQVAFEDVEEQLNWLDEDFSNRVIIMCSCPARIGDDSKIMEKVDTMCRGKSNVEITFSRAGNAAANLYKSDKVSW